MEKIPENPFENIALALSGGGFRAAAFGLGTMSYLHSLPWGDKSMLEHVSFISSTSGGSITLAYYTVRLYEGMPIPQILQSLYKTLEGDQLLEAAMERLADVAIWKEYPHKQRNLINAFAITYDRDLFQRITLKEFWKATGNPHLEEVSINSTELNNGTSFRFKLCRSETNVRAFGNSYLRFKPNAVWAVQSLRIGDIVAASSCFPLGFEPIIFPDDFVSGDHTPASMLAAMEIYHNNPLEQDAVQHRSFGLIDGGAVDNQGIYSMVLEDGSRFVKPQGGPTSLPADGVLQKPFSLLIISDVASYFLSPYSVPTPSASLWQRIPLLTILPAMIGAALMPFLATAIYANDSAPWYNYILLAPGFLLSGIVVWLLAAGIKGLRSQSEPAVVKTLRKHLFQILWRPIGWWWQALRTRNISFRMLAQDVFLKQIRRMHQRMAFEDKNNHWRLLSNFIYDLSLAQRHRREDDAVKKDGRWWPIYADRLRPSPALEAVAEAARNVGTTLWFDKSRPQDRENVVATAQFTTCYNLIRYLNRLEVAAQAPLAPDMEALRKRLLADWAQFQADPLWMLGTLRENGIPPTI